MKFAWFRKTADCRFGQRLAIVLVSLAVFSFAHAQESPNAFRRIMVPADDPASWPRDGETFLPVEAAEFDAALAAAAGPPATAVLTEAEYSARLVGTSLVGGRGRWRVERAGARPALLVLGEVSLEIDDATWKDESAQGSASSGVKLGWWSSGDEGAAQYGLLAPRSGDVEFVWRTDRLRATSAGTIEVPLALPAATSTRLTLDLPAGKRPVVAGGVVLESPKEAGGAGRWVLAVDAAAAKLLRIESTKSVPLEIAPTVSVERNLRYDVTQRGLDVTATLAIAPNGSELKELSFALSPGLKLVAALVDGEPMNWRIAPAADADETATATIELPANIARRPSEVELRAWGPLEMGQPQLLPRLTTRDALWTSGTIEVVVDDSLQVMSITPTDCLQTDQALGDAALAGAEASGTQRLSFDCYSPQSSIELTLGQRPPAATVRIGSALKIGNPNSDARVVAEVQVERGSLHALTADVRAGWMIAAVETLPADALAEWYVEGDPAARTLEVRLRHAATATAPVTVIVTGRLRRSSRLDPMEMDELSAIAWRGLRAERELVSLEAVEPFELEVVGELPTVSGSSLSAEDRRLFEYAVPNDVIDVAATNSGAVRLTAVQGTYDAEIQIEATLAGRRLVQKSRVECVPHGSGIDHVLVHWSEPTPAPPRWIDADTQEPLVAQRMPANDPRLGGLPAGGELWQLSLRRQYARLVTLEATLATDWPQKRRAPLVSLPDAATQRGRITVNSTELESPSIATRGMTPAPLAVQVEMQRDDRGQLAAEPRAIYRYQPTRFYDGATPPQLWLGLPAALESAPRLVARSVNVDSHVAANGMGRHRIRYELDNQGADRVVLALAENTTIDTARVGGEPVNDLPRDAQARQLVIRLPLRQRDVELELELRSEHRPLSEVGRLAAPLPASTMTVLGGEWKLWLPQEFAAESEYDAGQGRFDWRRRLFGPLARPQYAGVFNPFDAGDWNSVWNRLNFAGARSALAAPTEDAAAIDDMPTGWQPHEFHFLVEPPQSVEIVERTTTTAWALAVFLVALLAVCSRRVPASYVAMLAIAAAFAAVLLPNATAPLATATLLGILFASAWRWVLRPADTRTVRIRNAALAMCVVAVGVASSTARFASAAEPAAAIHRVLVPVDKEGKPTDTKYFVSGDFLRQLLAASQPEPPGGAWLIMAMHCRGEFVKPADQPGIEVGSWSVSFDVDVLARNVVLELPLVEREADWASMAMLDGIPAALAWNEAGNRCSVRVTEPGQYRLTIAFEPRVEEAEGRRQIALTLPPIPGADIRWTSPQLLADFSHSGEAFVRRDEPTRTVWEGALDGSGHVAASWSDTPTGAMTSASRRVKELLWLRIAPTGVTLNARYLLQNGVDWPATIDVTFDSRWQLLPSALASATDVQPLPDGRQVVRLRPPRSTGEVNELALEFRLRGRTPLGRLRVPEIRLESIPASERALAVSCDSALICESSSEVQPAATALAQFAAAWHDVPGATLPQFVWDAARLEAGWYLAVRPNVAPSTFREQLSVLAQQNRLQLTHQTEVEPQSADQFRWAYSVPADLVIDDVQLVSGNREVPVEWVRATPNRVNVFFAERVADLYQLELVGSSPVKRFGRQLLPRITAAERPLATQTVSLYRSPDVLAAWQFPAEAPRLEGAAGETLPFDADARFVRAYAVDPATADAARFVVEANEPVFEGTSLTSLDHEDGEWTVGYAMRLQVKHGELDELRLRVPRSWSGPFTSTPIAKLEYTPAADAVGPATLTVRLPQPVRTGDSLAVEILAPLRSSEGEPIAAPKIEPLAARSWTTYLALPGTLDGEPTNWSQHDVAAAKLPKELATSKALGGTAAKATTFRVTGSRMSVALAPRAAGETPPTVRLADTTFEIDPAGGRLATTRFILAPQGIGECTIELPTDERLVRATLDGHPALVRAVDPRHWRVQLDSPSLPQSLEIVSRAVEQHAANRRLVELHRPSIQFDGKPLPVEINLWTLDWSGGLGTPRVTGATTMTPAEQAALRLDRLVGISQSATRLLVESPVIDAFNWFGSWSAELQAAAQAARTLKQPVIDEAAAVRVTPPADDPLTEIVSRCDSWLQRMDEFFADAQLGVVRPTAAADRSSVWMGAERFCFISDGAEDRLRIEFVEPGLAAGAARSVALASIAVLAVAVLWFARTPTAIAWISRRPELIGVIAGIAAWAWFRPSFVGLFVATICLVLALRREYRERKRASRDKSPRHEASPRHDKSPRPEISPRHSGTSQSSSIPEELA